MGRKAKEKLRKQPTEKVNRWLSLLLNKLQTIPLANLTIDDLAKLSGISKSTIYKYFECKEEVILAACQTRNVVVIEIMQKIQQDISLPIEVRYTKLLEEFTANVSDITISFFHDVQLYYPTAWDSINKVGDMLVAILEELYQLGMEKGLFRPISIDLLKALDKYFVTEIVSNQEIFKDPDYTLDYLVRDYLRLRLEGLNK